MVRVVAICISLILIGAAFVVTVARKAIGTIAEFMDDSFRWG